MKAKIKPIVPKGAINKAILDAIKKEQSGSDALYTPAKKTGIFAGTLRRTLETEHTWEQALHLYNICNLYKLDMIELLKFRKKELEKQK